MIKEINAAIKYAKENNLVFARVELANVDSQVNKMYMQAKGADAFHEKRRKMIHMVGERINTALRNANDVKIFIIYLRQAIVLIERFRLE